MLSLPRVQVQSLVQELRSSKPGQAFYLGGEGFNRNISLNFIGQGCIASMASPAKRDRVKNTSIIKKKPEHLSPAWAVLSVASFPMSSQCPLGCLFMQHVPSQEEDAGCLAFHPQFSKDSRTAPLDLLWDHTTHALPVQRV